MTEQYYMFLQAAPATLGSLFFIPVLAGTIWSGLRSGHSFIPDRTANSFEFFLWRAGLLVSSILLTLFGFFQFFGPAWLVGYQTAFFGTFALYATWTMDRENLGLVAILSLFNWFCLTGHLPILGYSSFIVETVDNVCVAYFGLTYDSARCSGFFVLLRLLGLLSVFFQAFSAVAAFHLWRTPESDQAARSAPQQPGVILTSSYQSL